MARESMWRRYARFFGADAKADAEDEIAFHLESRVEELVAEGWEPREAMREARKQFGDVEGVRRVGEAMGKVKIRKVERMERWASWRQDFAFAMRGLRREKSFALLVIAILALGIGANTAVFSVVNALHLRPLPFPEADQLVWMESGDLDRKAGKLPGGLSSITYTVDAYREMKRSNTSLAELSAYNPFFGNGDLNLTGKGEPQAVQGVMVVENFLHTLRLQAAMGRGFTAEECKNGSRVVVLTHGFWQRYFGGAADVLGKTIQLNREDVAVVGVLPERFDFGNVFSPGLRVDLLLPAPLEEMRRWGNTLALFGRLKPGVSLAAAQAEMDILMPRLHAEHKEWWGDYRSQLQSLKAHVSGKLAKPLEVLWAAVGTILLLVCVNLANLMLARAMSRSKEFALRSALGAGWRDLLRPMLMESSILTAAGAALGLGMAYGLTAYLRRQGDLEMPLLQEVRVDGAAVLWTLGLSVGASLLFAIAPAIRLGGGKLMDLLKESGAGMSAGRNQERLRGALVAGEIALACVLLVGAGLMLRSFLKVLDVDLGFQPSQAYTMKVIIDDGGKRENRGPVLMEMLRRVKEVPGVEEAGITDMLPLGRNRSWGLRAIGEESTREPMRPVVIRVVTPGLLDAMGIRKLRGRDFKWSDRGDSKGVVIINEAAEKALWKGKDALGREAMQGDRKVEVIAVVHDVKDQSVEKAPGPEMYMTMTQAGAYGSELVLRSKRSAAELALPVMQALRSYTPEQPAVELMPLGRIVERANSVRRFIALLVAAFAGLGLVLAMLGVYGVISYSVTRQRQEIGIRMALGASGGQVRMGVVSSAMKLAGAGLAGGMAAAWLAASWLEGVLYGTSARDPWTYAGIAMLLAAVSLLAALQPAWRASSIDPMGALRSQ